MPDLGNPGRVVAYVSGHGFGHAAREIEILRHLPTEIPLTIKSASAEWFWRAEMGRPFEFISDRFDVGCIQRDAIEIDIPATYAACVQIAAQNHSRLADEIEYLKRVDAQVVVSDVPSFPLVAAAKAGIPGICVANFTWADIYANFVEKEPRFGVVVEDLINQYQSASVCLETDLALPMKYFPRLSKVGLVARPGTSHRDRLEGQLPSAAHGKRLALIYLGAWGYPIPYSNLEQFDDWHFLSLDTPPTPVSNWTTIDRANNWSHPDLVASVDLVISKPGYGIVGECLSTGTPLLYPPRPQFAEYPGLEAALTTWPGGQQIPNHKFLALEWHPYLNAIPAHETLPKLPAPGGPNAAQRITYYYNHHT